MYIILPGRRVYYYFDGARKYGVVGSERLDMVIRNFRATVGRTVWLRDIVTGWGKIVYVASRSDFK